MIEYKKLVISIVETDADIFVASLDDLEAGFDETNTLPLWKDNLGE